MVHVQPEGTDCMLQKFISSLALDRICRRMQTFMPCDPGLYRVLLIVTDVQIWSLIMCLSEKAHPSLIVCICGVAREMLLISLMPESIEWEEWSDPHRLRQPLVFCFKGIVQSFMHLWFVSVLFNVLSSMQLKWRSAKCMMIYFIKLQKWHKTS